MNQNQVSPLQLTQLRKLPVGLTESSHLSNAYLTEPERMDGVLAFAFGTQNENVLSMLTGGLGNTRFIENREYKWDLHGQVERSLEISAAPITTSDKPGYGGAPIQMKFAEALFQVSDNIVSDDGTSARVSRVVSNGLDFIVTVQLNSPDATKWLDSSQIQPGARWSKDYSTVEEYSTKGGGTDFQAPMTLTNQLTTLRKGYPVTRSAATDVMIIDLYGPDGQSTKLWTKLAEWTALGQWYREIDRMLLYSEYNKNAVGLVSMKGENGRPVYHGAGLRQQISPANKRTYFKLTYELLDNFLLDLSYNANRWGGNYNFVALTGKMGMREFSNAITERQNALGITVTTNGTFISGSGTELELAYGFRKVTFLNGISLTVKEFHPYDDIVRHRTKHPVSGKPLESYRFTILNFGTVNGKANIRKVAKKNSENAMWHVCGSTTPFGDVAKSTSTMRSSGIDGYEVHLLSEIGIQVQDPTSCGELIMVLS
jgi:hypothetical protein